MDIKCEICGKIVNRQRLSRHIVIHDITPKEYYDKYLKTPTDNKCIICGKPTKFKGLGLKGGYSKYCGVKCSLKDPEVQTRRLKGVNKAIKENLDKINEKRRQTNLKNYGVDNPSKSKIIQKKLSTKAKQNFSDPDKAKSILDKRSKTVKEKYGVDHYLQSEDSRIKSEQTNLKKYGVKHPMQNKEIRKKISDTYNKIFSDPKLKEELLKKRKVTWMKKYGVDNPSRVKEIREKISSVLITKYKDSDVKKDVVDKRSKTNLKRYGVTNVSVLKEIQEKILLHRYESNQHIIQTKIDKLNTLKFPYTLNEMIHDKSKRIFTCKECDTEYTFTHFSINQLRCKKCSKSISYLEEEFRLFLLENNINFEIHNRSIISPYELDFYLPDYDMAFELHGLYWHSELAVFREFGLTEKSNISDYMDIITREDFHTKRLKFQNAMFTKWDMCKKKGIKLVQILEDEWVNNLNIVKSRIKHMLGISDKKLYARKLEIRACNGSDASTFLGKNHLQGYGVCRFRYGAYTKDNELVAMMTFSKGSIAKGNSAKIGIWEISRFAIKQGYSIVGIANKLFKHFIRRQDPTSIFTYADLRWSEGKIYEKLGMELQGHTGIGYWYTDLDNRLNRFKFRKEFDEPSDIPEWVLRLTEGLYRVWDCGNYKYIWTKGEKE